MKYRLTLLSLSLAAAFPVLAQNAHVGAHGHIGAGAAGARSQGATQAQLHANPQALERANANSALRRTLPAPTTPTVPTPPSPPMVPTDPADTPLKSAGKTLDRAARTTAQTTQATKGVAKQGRKAVNDTLFGITPDAKGRFDLNGDGSITNDEIQASNRIRAAVQSGTTNAQFKAIDTDGDGVLSLEEMQAFRGTLNRPVAVNLGIRANSQGQFDFNGDGAISSAEASASLRVQTALKDTSSTLFKQIDVNGDLMLSADELRAFSLLPTP